MTDKNDKKKQENETQEPQENLKSKRQPCEVFSRVVGYIRPVHQWNKGKQSEFKDRRMLNLPIDEKKRDKKD